MERGLSSLKDALTGDRIFEVPVYQRNYAWTRKQWDDLWNDIAYLKPGRRHYFGTILLKRTERQKESGLRSFDVFELVDGQQRVATVLIAFREILSSLRQRADEETKKQLQRLEEDYLKYGGAYKLSLLGEDERFFRRYVVDDEEYPDETLTPSQVRLKEAKSHFRRRIDEWVKNLDGQKARDSLLELKEKIDGLDVIRYEVDNDADAILIFETVNDRGKDLTNLEKTKSFLMHAIYLASPSELDTHLKGINESFSSIFRWYEDIRDIERWRNLEEDDIQRYHFINFQVDVDNRRETSHRYIDHLKERIRTLYRKDEKESLDFALDYTKDLEDSFFTLREVVTYAKDDEIGKHLERIFQLGRTANFLPLMIAIWMRSGKKRIEVANVLKLIEATIFRVYAIGRKRSDAGVGWLYEMAFGVHSDEWTNGELIEDLGDLLHHYSKDRDFERNLRADNFYERIGTRDIKYLLFEYERHLRKEAKEPLDISWRDIASDRYQIEHIWPRDPSRLGLDGKGREEHEEYVDRLGNLTLASKNWNARWKNSPFREKSKEYSNSSLGIQRTLGAIEDWDAEQIEKREKAIVEFCKVRWRSPRKGSRIPVNVPFRSES